MVEETTEVLGETIAVLEDSTMNNVGIEHYSCMYDTLAEGKNSRNRTLYVRYIVWRQK